MGIPETKRNIVSKISRGRNHGGVLPAMSKRYWMHGLAVGGLLAASICISGGGVVAQGPGNDPGGEQRTAEDSRKSESDNKSVTLRTLQDAVNRIASAIEAKKDDADAKRKDQREQDDLEAQRDMARWAKYSGWTAIASAIAATIALIVTTAGVILVWRTLIHTKRAAEAAAAMVGHAAAATEAAEETTEEARKATKFAQVTADAAREALAVTDRAWIKLRRN